MIAAAAPAAPAASSTILVVTPGLPSTPRSSYTDRLGMMEKAAKQYGARLVTVLPEDHSEKLPRHLAHMKLGSPADASALVRVAQQVTGTSFMIPLREAAVLPCAEAAETLGLSSVTPTTATNARDKLAMKSALRAADIAVADFTGVNSQEGLNAFAQKHQYRVVVKPREDASCLGTRLITTAEDVEDVWNAIKNHPETFIAEAFVAVSREYHSNLVVRGGQRVFHALGQYSSPLLLDLFACDISRHVNLTPLEASIEATSLRVLQALGVYNEVAPAHIEYLVDKQGRLLVGEVALRLPGGAIVELFERTTGINMAAAWINALLDPQYVAKQKRPEHDLASELLGLNHSAVLTALPAVADLQKSAPEVHSTLWWTNPGETVPEALGSSANRFGSVFFQVPDEKDKFPDVRERVKSAVYSALSIVPLQSAG